MLSEINQRKRNTMLSLTCEIFKIKQKIKLENITEKKQIHRYTHRKN